MSPELGRMDPRPPQGRGAAPITFLLHHFSRALLEDGVGLDNLGPAPAPAVPIALPIPVPLLLLLLDGDILSGPGERGGGLSPPLPPATLQAAGPHLRARFAHRDPATQVPAGKTASAPHENAYEATYSSLIFLLIMLGVKVFCKREQRDKSLHERR